MRPSLAGRVGQSGGLGGAACWRLGSTRVVQNWPEERGSVERRYRWGCGGCDPEKRDTPEGSVGTSRERPPTGAGTPNGSYDCGAPRPLTNHQANSRRCYKSMRPVRRGGCDITTQSSGTAFCGLPSTTTHNLPVNWTTFEPGRQLPVADTTPGDSEHRAPVDVRPGADPSRYWRPRSRTTYRSFCDACSRC